MARPTKYKVEFANQAEKISKFGATDKDLAEIFGVDESTITRWKQKYPEFCMSLKKGKDYFDNKVEIALAERAIGYSHPEEKIFNHGGEILRVETVKHHPPDVTACIYWLNNRKRKEWATRKAVESEMTISKLPEGTGVLVVPAVVDYEQWAEMAVNGNKELDRKEREFDKKNA
ncbi:helix-turn-helix domain-containing protein [Marinicella litoralis]|uniref:Phage terminase small subunit n=1 Tax=Marinicella litoralis TaxID=644220 RepID=A0A4R6XBS7_9GAMM|nr:helix-turn-helix domain-containing protein [Marinicella litoralis]TDR14627.1 hypothetical protein C8D91_2954 [Marinicella litoralis]